jgi:anaerobic C4-dicarboxylate transporter
LDPFWLKLFITFCVGGLWVTLTTTAAELLGPKLGGWIGGLPSTIVVTLFFTGLIVSAQAASDITTTIPLAIGINSLFLLIYSVLATRGFAVGMGGSLLVWLLLSGLVVVFGLSDFAFSLVASLLSPPSLITFLRTRSTCRLWSD